MSTSSMDSRLKIAEVQNWYLYDCKRTVEYL
jgi:hypothetical protein